ncbi:MAG TPA: tetratricopeptide repeat protein [Pyrinomonadaceae bacterium]|jgi:Flp pilus assembly protein TadD
MQIDTPDAKLKTAVIAGAIGITVAAPYLAPYFLPFLAPFLIDVAKAGVTAVGGVASNALWDLRGSFKPTHENEDLTRLLGKAYSRAIEDVLKQAENNQANEKHKKLIELVLPSIKEKLDEHLATNKSADLFKLFPSEENLAQLPVNGEKKLPFYQRLFGRKSLPNEPVSEEFLTQHTSEEFILKLSDDGAAAKRLIAEEVEISLRRWFVQLNPALANEYSFPPSLDKYVFEKIGELIPQKINEIVKEEDFSSSWIAFQRSHLQAILRQVNDKQNGLSDEDRELLRPLGEFLDKLSKNNELVENLANGTSEILKRIGQSEENVKKCVAEESRKFQSWLEANLGQIITVTTKNLEVSERTESKVDKQANKLDEIEEAISKIIVSPFPSESSPNFVVLPNLKENIYGREEEIAAITEFLETEEKHPIIIAPTCFGKTSLIKKFLTENINEDRTASKRHDLFSKIIYLDCRKYDNFAGIAQHFATLLQTSLEYETGKEEHFLKHTVFPKIKADKVLMIFDNFEAWIENGRYKNNEVAVFLNTFFIVENRIRAVFISWHSPDKEIEFDTQVNQLQIVSDKLLEGLEHNAAIEMVRGEGGKYCGRKSIVDLDSVSEADLTEFFKDVYYIPQAIQSMVHFIGRRKITFSQFLTEYQAAYQAEERDETNLEEKRDKRLRPTNALIKLQISLLSEKAKYLLRHIAFYGIDVPQEILILSEEDLNRPSEENRVELNRLVDDRLVIQTVNRDDDDKRPFILHNLHPFVRGTVRRDFALFETEHEEHLENLADQMWDKIRNTWENKLFYKQLALTECWEKLEDYFISEKGKLERQVQRGLVDFIKALASQEIAETFAVKLSGDQKRQLQIKSEKLYVDYLKKNPNDANAYYNLGILHNNEGRIKEAIDNFRKAIELKPNYANAYNNLGNLLKDQGRIKEAEDSYHKSIELNPKNTDAYYNLGIFLKEKGRKKEAIDNFRKAIELKPNDADAYNNLGILLKNEGRNEEAEDCHRKAIELNPNNAEAYGNLSLLKAEYKGEQDKDEIIECLRKCVGLNPAYKEWAKTTFEKFDFLRDDRRFKEIVGD